MSKSKYNLTFYRQKRAVIDSLPANKDERTLQRECRAICSDTAIERLEADHGGPLSVQRC